MEFEGHGMAGATMVAGGRRGDFTDVKRADWNYFMHLWRNGN